jgi:hypothetical protein
MSTKVQPMSTLRAVVVPLSVISLFQWPALAKPEPPKEMDKPKIHGTLLTEGKMVVLGAKDFLSDLPQELQNEEYQRKTATIEVDKKVKFEVMVHYDQLTGHPEFFRRAEVTMTSQVPGVMVGVVFGYPINLGTSEKPLMAVPFNLQWSGEGWLRGEQWTLYADGRLKKTE